MAGETGPDDASALLSDAAAARGAIIGITGRPAWKDALLSVPTGVACGVAAGRSTMELAAAAVILTLTMAAMIVVEVRSVRRRGRILDERALGAHAARYAVFYLPLSILGLVRAPDDWWPWYAIAVGVLVAGLGFAYLRLDERYQARRLATGDYGRHDIV